MIEFLVPLGELPQPFPQTRVGLEAKVPFQRAGIRIGNRHVAWLHGHQLLVRLEVVVLRQYARADQLLLQDVHKIQQVLRAVVADVVDRVGRHRQAVLAYRFFRRVPHHPHHAFHDVVHIGEVALAVAIVEDLDLLSLYQLVGEAEVGHVRTASGAVDREKAQARGRDVVQLGIRVGQQFVRLLGSRVKADGVVHLVVRGVRHLFVAAVHTG